MITTETLSQFGLFNGLPELLLSEIAAICSETSYKNDEYVFREGENS